MKLKFPEELRKLEKPYFILDTPICLQYSFVIVFCFFIPLIISIWIYIVYTRDGLQFYHYFFAALGSIFFSFSLSNKMWVRWIHLAADRKGIYLASDKLRKCMFIPWEKVGSSYIGIAGRGENREKCVIL